ncbi:hypothetical protein ACFL5E_03260 [Candidatus Omnitrophota bacterium]
MPDTFAITIIFIAVSTIVGAFIKGRTKDRCLCNLSGYTVTLEKTDGKIIWGKLKVENSGMELVYKEPYIDKADNHVETSYILYKSEYDQIKTIVRYIDKLTPERIKKREASFKKIRHPGWGSRLMRKIRNFFGTVRDSLLEIANLFMGRVKTTAGAGKLLQGQDKYVSQMQQQTVTALGSSYEPILERYIGKKVVLALVRDGKKEEYSGILRDYTTEFIEIMDTVYAGPVRKGVSNRAGTDEQAPRRADIVVPRATGMVKHFGE